MSSRLAAKTLDHAPQQCGDFLAQIHLKPRGVRYIGCSYLPDRQGKPLRATYHVPGQYAARAERIFVNAVGMPSLRRSCCQWDAPPHWFHGADGQQARLVGRFLGDPLARLSSFPRHGSSEFPFAMALKTGTSQGYRGAWTLAWSHGYLVRVWVSRADAGPLHTVSENARMGHHG